MSKKNNERETELLGIIAADATRATIANILKKDLLLAPLHKEVCLCFDFSIGEYQCLRKIKVPRELARDILRYVEDWSKDDRISAEKEFDRL